MNNAWWVIIGPNGEPVGADGTSSDFSIFASKEKAQSWAEEPFETADEYRILPVGVSFLDEKVRRQSRKRRRW